MRQPKRDGQAHSDEGCIEPAKSRDDDLPSGGLMAFLLQWMIIFWHGFERHALAHIAIALRRRPRKLLHMIIRFTQFGRDLGLSCRHGDTGGWATIVGPCSELGRRQALSINS
jgi:hypothetical protein